MEYEKILSIRETIDGIDESTDLGVVKEKLRGLNEALKKDDGHFTYRALDSSTLKQGDILEKTSDLCNLFKKYHSYFERDQYVYFIVLTQTCDLVQRGDGPKSNYITLAAIRSFEDFISKEIANFPQTELEKKGGILNQKHQAKLFDSTKKLFNNNHHEFFYLHEQNMLNFPSGVAYLRLSITLKIEHYDVCLAAKRLQLREDFTAKLGWLLGDLYSRVGTQDWVPNPYSEKEFNNWINKTIENNCAFVSGKRLQKLSRRFDGVDLSSVKKIDILNELKNINDENFREIFNGNMKKILFDMKLVNDDDEAEIIINKINSTSELMSCIKR